METSSSALQHTPSWQSCSWVSPLLKLAREEVQSIMQFLPRLELLYLCRCSRTLLADGDADSAWCTQPPFEVGHLLTAADSDSDHFRSFSSSCLFMRRAGFSLRSSSDFPGVNSQLIVTMLDTIPRSLKRLTIMRSSFISANDWKRLLEHSGLNQLQELYLRCDWSELTSTLLSRIERLTHLTALTLPSNISYDSVVGLRTFTRLKFLGVSRDVQRPNSEDSISTGIVDNCKYLTSLHIGSPALRMEQFFTIFSSSNLSQLKQLSLSNWQWFDGHIDAAGQLQVVDEEGTLDRFRTIWQTMVRLEGLILSEVVRINPFIPTLTSAPSLKELVFGLPSYMRHSSIPDTDRITDLLLHSRDLCVTISTNRERIQIYDYLHPVFPTRIHRLHHPNLATYHEWASTHALILSIPSPTA